MSDAAPMDRSPKMPGQEQLSERVAAYLREGIMSGELASDTFIRTEALAQELDMSATPIREALMILHSEGTVQWEPRRGFRIPTLSRAELEDLFMVQSWIGGELARRAAKSMTPADMDQLDKYQEGLEAASVRGDVESVDDFNHQIHLAIYAAAHSERLSSLLNSTVTYVPLRYIFQQVPNWDQTSVHDHGAILKALRTKSAANARDAMTEHVWNIGNLLIDHLEVLGRLQAPATAD